MCTAEEIFTSILTLVERGDFAIDPAYTLAPIAGGGYIGSPLGAVVLILTREQQERELTKEECAELAVRHGLRPNDIEEMMAGFDGLRSERTPFYRVGQKLRLAS